MFITILKPKHLLHKGYNVFLQTLFINFANNLGIINFQLFVIGDASSAALVMTGISVAGIYEKMADKGKDANLWFTLILTAIIFIVAGIFIRPFAGGISKIHATPAWVFICAGISILIFSLLIWLIDIKNKRSWFHFIRPGGTSTLTCYLIPYILYSIVRLTDFSYPAFFNEGIGGLLRSFAIAFLVIGLVGIMEKYRLRLKI